MKHFLIIVIILFVAGFGFYLLKPEPSLVQKPIEPKFFSPSEILPTDTVIKITAIGFEPAEVSVKEGTRVVFINESPDYAWPASNPHPLHTDYPEFDPKEPLKNGEAWASIFDKPGMWKYHDHMKSSRRGVVNVSF